MEKDKMLKTLMSMFIELKSTQFHKIAKIDGLNQNEKIVLFFIKDFENEKKVSLSKLREKLKLAPSTVTAIVTSLECKGLIERTIDKADRRNIFLELSHKGKEYTDEAHENLIRNIQSYIDYMGKEDTNELIRLVSKTTVFFNERMKK